MTSNYLTNLHIFPLYKQLPNGKELIFIHIPKTAGTSVKYFFDFPKLSEDSPGGFKKHYTVSTLEGFISEDVWKRAFTFTFVRNPWERLYSLYRFRNMKRKRKQLPKLQEFNSWLVGKCRNNVGAINNLQPQTNWIKNINPVYKLNFVGRYENLQSDIDYICQQVGHKREQLPYINKSPGMSAYRNVYTQVAKDAIANFYHEDITTFGYEF